MKCKKGKFCGKSLKKQKQLRPIYENNELNTTLSCCVGRFLFYFFLFPYFPMFWLSENPLIRASFVVSYHLVEGCVLFSLIGLIPGPLLLQKSSGFIERRKQYNRMTFCPVGNFNWSRDMPWSFIIHGVFKGNQDNLSVCIR